MHSFLSIRQALYVCTAGRAYTTTVYTQSARAGVCRVTLDSGRRRARDRLRAPPFFSSSSSDGNGDGAVLGVRHAHLRSLHHERTRAAVARALPSLRRMRRAAAGQVLCAARQGLLSRRLLSVSNTKVEMTLKMR